MADHVASSIASSPSPSRPPPGTQALRTVLVVDDEKNIRRTLQLVLEGEGYRFLGAETATQALAILASPETPVDLAILDVKLPDMSGLDALAKIRGDEATRDLPIIVISGHATVNDAVQAIKLGASDFFEKPLGRERVLVSVRNVLDAAKARRELARVTEQQLQRYEMIGRSAVMQRIFHEHREGGADQGVGAHHRRERHGQGAHRARHPPAVPALRRIPSSRSTARPSRGSSSRASCSATRSGAFTGAMLKRRGLFEQAHGGTLFLDEIGDMDLVAQAKVLRAVQSGEISRVGSEHVIHVDVRVLAATNKDLREGRRERDVPRGPLLSPRRLPDPQPRAARASRGHPAPGAGLHGAVRPRERRAAQADRRRRRCRPWCRASGRATCASSRTSSSEAPSSAATA